MKLEIDDLGVVGIIVDDWSFEKDFKSKTIVTDYTNWKTYISRRAVPSHIPLTDTYYWKPILKPFGGGSIEIDDHLDEESVNPVQNKVITEALKNIEDPSEYIKNASVSEDGNTLILTKKDENTVTFAPKGESITLDDQLSETSENPVQNKVITVELNKKPSFGETEGMLQQKADTSSVSELLGNVAAVDERLARNESAYVVDKAALQTVIETEENERRSEDSSIRNTISSEIQTRESNEANINSRISTVSGALENVYNKTEVNNLISNTPESDVVIVEGQEGVDPITLLPNPGQPNTLYRIMDASGESFSEYGWNGTAYKKLSTYYTGIDDNPTPDSGKLITSNAVSKANGYCKLANGSCGNPANGEVVRTWYVPINNKKYFKVETNRPNSPNTRYHFCWCLISDETLLYTTTPQSNNTIDFIHYENYIDTYCNNIADVSKYPGAKGIAFVISEISEVLNTTTNTFDRTLLRVSDFDGYYVKIVDAENEFHYIEYSGICELRNGSNGNHRNADRISGWQYPIGDNKAIGVKISRPNGPNCIYRYNYNLYKSLNNIYKNPESYTLEEGEIVYQSEYLKENVFDLSNFTTAKAVSVSIEEYNTETKQAVTLRLSDFENYEIVLLGTERNYIDVPNKDVDVIANGTIQNPSNAYCVMTYYFPIKDHRYCRFVTNRPNKKDHYYAFGYVLTRNSEDIGTHKYRNPATFVYSRVIEDCNSIPYLNVENYSEAVGIGFIIGEFSRSSNTVSTLRKEDFDGYKCDVVWSDTVNDYIGQPVIPCKLVNGSVGNRYNAYSVCTEVTPTENFKYFEFITDRPNSAGYHYEFAHGGTSESCGITGNKPGGLSVIESNESWRLKVVGRANRDSIGIAISIWEISDLDGTTRALRISDFDGYHTYIKRSGIFTDITDYDENSNIRLISSCRYRKTSEKAKDFQMLLISDSHDDNPVVENAVKALNGFDTIDALIHCGDFTDNIKIGQDKHDLWKDIVANANKPFYAIIGNHECCNYKHVVSLVDDSVFYNTFIKPSVDAGYLVSGEYTENRLYYYHDFVQQKVRLIALYEYEVPKVFDTTYWRPIAYSSNYSNFGWNTSYNAGDKVKIDGYTTYAFEAVQNIDNTGTFYVNPKAPDYKYRAGRWITQTQAQWFLDTLMNTPYEYKIIVALHSPFSSNAVVIDAKFSQNDIWRDNFVNEFDYMENDFIADAIDAFEKGINFTTNCVSKYPEDMTGYTVSANFSNKHGGVFHSLIGGHVHKDLVWKHKVYNQYQITPICANTNNPNQCPDSDIRRSNSTYINDKTIDCLTAVSFGENRIGLVKLGTNVSEDGYNRDFEVINKL